MPTYEYACADCGHQWEAFQSIKDSALTTCASCGNDSAERLITGGAGFILRGGGWYSDLYGSNKPRGESSAGSEASTAKGSPAASSDSSSTSAAAAASSSASKASESTTSSSATSGKTGSSASD